MAPRNARWWRKATKSIRLGGLRLVIQSTTSTEKVAQKSFQGFQPHADTPNPRCWLTACKPESSLRSPATAHGWHTHEKTTTLTCGEWISGRPGQTQSRKSPA